MNDAHLQHAVQQAGFAGLRVDADSHIGALVHRNGAEQRVFVKAARNAHRLAREGEALRRIHLARSDIPVPQLLSHVETNGIHFVLFAYIDGHDLVALLPDDPNAPPLPPYYQRKRTIIDIAQHARLKLLAALGQIVRRLHAIRLPAFGLLIGDEPNPYRNDARAFTYQEARHALNRCVATARLSDHDAQNIDAWIIRRLALIDAAGSPCLVHNDLHPGNIRVAIGPHGNWHIAALVDFEMARSWLPERDLATLVWYLGGEHSTLWQAFVSGYGAGEALNRQRLQLFEMIRALGAMAYSEQHTPWARWCAARVNQLLHE